MWENWVSFDLDSRRAFDVSDVFAVVVVGCFNDCEEFLSMFIC